MHKFVALAANFAFGCAEPPAPAPAPASTCDGIGAVVQHAGVAERKLLGAAAPYAADAMLRSREATLGASMAERRAAGWAAVARILAPAPFAIEPNAGAPAVLPTWHTWYDADELRRLFAHLGEQRPPRSSRDRLPFSDEELDAAFAWSPTAVDDLPTWPADRWQAFVHSLDTEVELHGVGGLSRVGYSPSAARHVLASYAQIVGCQEQGTPPPIADGPEPGPRRLLRESISLAACQRTSLGPYYVDSGAHLVASLGAGVGDASLTMRTQPDAAFAPCDEARCQASGPGPVWIELTANQAGTFAVDIDYAEANPTWAACLREPFPLDAAIVKAQWRRADFDLGLAVHDTSGHGLAALADDTWPQATAFAHPAEDQAHTLALPEVGARYRLAGLHLMTKELDHWLWVTLWWSANPDEDFGADRPASVSLLPGPWRNYKMCVVTAFDESATVAGLPPSLTAALQQMHTAPGPSFCSNPFLEEGAGNATTNCIGCHQHGGTHLANDLILSDDNLFPDNGRRQTRNNFPADYSWQTTHGGLGIMLSDELRHASQNRQ